MSKDAVVAFGTFTKIEAFVDFFAVGNVCVALLTVGVLDLISGPKCAAIGTLSQRAGCC